MDAVRRTCGVAAPRGPAGASVPLLRAASRIAEQQGSEVHPHTPAIGARTRAERTTRSDVGRSRTDPPAVAWVMEVRAIANVHY